MNADDDMMYDYTYKRMLLPDWLKEKEVKGHWIYW